MHDHAQIGPLRATLLVAGNMIGSGVYLLPQSLAATGSSSVIGWIIASAGAFLLAFVFAMLFQLRPASVGMVQQVRDGLGRFFGFQTSLLYWIAGWVGNVAIAVTATSYLGFFLPALRETWAALYPGLGAQIAPLAQHAPEVHAWLLNLGPGAICTIALIWLFTGLNLWGARRVTEFKGLSLALGLAPVLGVGVLGWFAFDPALFGANWNVSGRSDFEAIPATFVPILWAFLGLESAAIAGAVVKNPARDVPIATMGGVALAACVYVAAAAAMFGLTPASALANSGAPYADVAAQWLGPAAAGLVAACAVLKASGTLSGWILTTAEASRSGAESGVFPRFFKERAAGVPRRNLLISAALMTIAVIVSAAPTIGRQFDILIAVTTIVFLLLYAYGCVALWRMSADWRLRAACLVGGAFCVYAVSAAAQLELIYAAALVALTLPLYALTRKPVQETPPA